MREKLLPLLPSALLLWGAGCSAGDDLAAGVATGPLAGKDGPLVVSTRDTVVNRYAQLAQDAGTGDRRLFLRSAAPLRPLDRGDLLLLIQMQGATIDQSDSARYGEITALNNAGRYELVAVDSIEGDTVTLDGACRLRQSYSAAGNVQVIRVPQLTTLQIGSGGSITAPPWDGVRGGVLALHVQEAAQIDGLIDVTGRGFRGGQVDNSSGNNDGQNVIWRSTNAARGAEKGEGIAGGATVYDRLGGRYGRGAPANGGGGGNSHNAAGGGGANGNNGKAWSGQGVMDPTVTGAAAWALDPAYVSGGNRLTDSSGGGRGGYTFSKSITAGNPDPLRLAPGSPGWGGDWRREVGGLGGRPVPSDPAGRLYLGGGGGAGDGNDLSAGGGGNGGGLVLLLAGSVSGAGQIVADGQSGGDTRNDHNDGAGGGGAGGTVVVAARSMTGPRISANGGRGGNQMNSPRLQANAEAEGPGGGGGGGYIAVSAGNIMTSAAGGAGGTSATAAVAPFPANGATRGAGGQALEVAIPAAIPICLGGGTTSPDLGGGDGGTAPGGSDLSVRITVSPDPIQPDRPVTYTISVTNKGPDAAYHVKVTYTVPEGGTIESIEPGPGWQCTQQGRTVTCVYGGLIPGDAPDIVIRVRLPSDKADPVTASASVGSSRPDPNPADNEVSVTTKRGGLSLAGGGLTCSYGGRAPAGARGLLGLLGLAALGLLRRRRPR